MKPSVIYSDENFVVCFPRRGQLAPLGNNVIVLRRPTYGMKNRSFELTHCSLNAALKDTHDRSGHNTL
jgi:hypothetical protein